MRWPLLDISIALGTALAAILFAYYEGWSRGSKWGLKRGARIARKRAQVMATNLARAAVAVEVERQIRTGLHSMAALPADAEVRSPAPLRVATKNERPPPPAAEPLLEPPAFRTASEIFEPDLVRDTAIDRVLFDDEEALSEFVIDEAIDTVLAPPYLRDLGRGEPVDVEVAPGQWKRALVWSPPARKDNVFLVGVRSLGAPTTEVFELHRVRRPLMPFPREE